MKRIVITEEQMKWLKELIANPPPPTEKLVEAMRKYQEFNCPEKKEKEDESETS
jgi:uncharacterized protein (DUF1778 family)